MNTLKVWMRLATKPERHRLAELAQTSVNYLYFLSNPKKKYGRTPSAELAQRLEEASDKIRNESAEARNRLPRLLRTDLSPTCSGCSFAQRCLGDAAIASEFEYQTLPSTPDAGE